MVKFSEKNDSMFSGRELHVVLEKVDIDSLIENMKKSKQKTLKTKNDSKDDRTTKYNKKSKVVENSKVKRGRKAVKTLHTDTENVKQKLLKEMDEQELNEELKSHKLAEEMKEQELCKEMKEQELMKELKYLDELKEMKVEELDEEMKLQEGNEMKREELLKELKKIDLVKEMKEQEVTEEMKKQELLKEVNEIELKKITLLKEIKKLEEVQELKKEELKKQELKMLELREEMNKHEFGGPMIAFDDKIQNGELKVENFAIDNNSDQDFNDNDSDPDFAIDSDLDFNDSDLDEMYKLEELKELETKEVDDTKGKYVGMIIKQEREVSVTKTFTIPTLPGWTENGLVAFNKQVPDDELQKQDGKYVCEFCGLKFTNKKKYRAHLVFHRRQLKRGKKRKAYICELCGLELRNYSSLAKHLQSLTHAKPEDAVQCQDCGQICFSKANFDWHKRTRHPVKSFDEICDICGKVFKFRKYLVAHKKRHGEAHKNNRIKCPVCKRVVSVNYYRTHFKSHKQKFDCEVCSKSFSCQRSLKRHSFTHINRKDHACHICGKEFVQKTVYWLHMEKHHDLTKQQLIIMFPEKHAHPNLRYQYTGSAKPVLSDQASDAYDQVASTNTGDS